MSQSYALSKKGEIGYTDSMQMEIIQEISQSNKTRVALVYLPDRDAMAIYKERRGQDPALFHRLQEAGFAFLPKIYEVEERDDLLCILEEQIPGDSLAAVMEDIEAGERKPFTEGELSHILSSIAGYLEALHGMEPPVIYRDLKPENLLLTPKGDLKLVDLDTAREYKEEATTDTIHLGTERYAAPEAYGFNQTDARSDIYSYGICMQDLISHAEVSPSYAKAYQQVLTRATMFAPKDRYQNLKELEQALMTLKEWDWKRKYIRVSILSCITLFVAGCAVGMCLMQIIGTKGQQDVTSENVASGSPESMTYEEVMALEGDDLTITSYALFEEQEDDTLSFVGYPDDVTPVVVYLPEENDGVSVTRLNDYALCQRSELVAVIIPEGYTSIGAYAISYVDKLQAIVVPASVTEIDEAAFLLPDTAVIYGYSGSYIETYAASYGFAFCAINE